MGQSKLADPFFFLAIIWLVPAYIYAVAGEKAPVEISVLPVENMLKICYNILVERGKRIPDYTQKHYKGETIMAKRSERIIKILMERDGDTREEAEARIADCRSELRDCFYGTNCMTAEEVIASELGLEPDYIFDLI